MTDSDAPDTDAPDPRDPGARDPGALDPGALDPGPGWPEDTDGSGPSDLEPPPEGQLSYDCADWAGETRSLFASLLVTSDIPHVWQGTTVTVPDEFEERVDELVEEVLGTARPTLDPDAAKVVYEVGAWPVALQTQLVDSLAAADVAYEWDERGDLVVLESDEEQVELVLADLPEPDDSEIPSDDGVAVHELLDSLFIASDRLARNANDASGTVNMVDAAAVVEQLALPFGFDPSQWRRFVSVVTALRDAISPSDGSDGDGTGAPPTDEEISELAAKVRDQVRQYV